MDYSPVSFCFLPCSEGVILQINCNSFCQILLFLPAENILVEIVVHLFAGSIDAELLKGIVGQVLKPEDVQDSYCH